ncbi:PREDICTED: bone morphogenetic protein 7-like [Thamnophis sirtalis]|uniref:Bone morphogenetic protein 7-like n=1 Tax=Thamnophis sirtalis TaxID=35019 RepID=A0A6I9YVL9_9SAUR|nr:PREDICTED: bone morphogenetic protein 7-like [Thamnophis sirtalis]
MMRKLLSLLLLLTWAPACLAKPTWGSEDSEDTRDQALKQLLEVFGIEGPPQPPLYFKEPPQYMVDLYNTVADADGVTKDPHLLEGNTVRSFLERKEQNQNQVRDWVAEESSNQGLLVTVQGLGGAPMDPHAVQFASGRDHHTSKKPMLVLFTDDGRRAAALPSGFPTEPILFVLPSAGLPSLPEAPSNRTRGPRSAESSLPCRRYPLPVEFDEIGWTGWIISPHGYNAYYCKGTCRFPLGQSMRPTNHATVQSIMHALKLNPEVHTPCCVPDKLFSINLLYFDDDETVVLKQYDGMVADSCGCH